MAPVLLDDVGEPPARPSQVIWVKYLSENRPRYVPTPRPGLYQAKRLALRFPADT